MVYDVQKYCRGGIWWLNDNTIEDKTKGERGILRGDRPVLIVSVPSNPLGNCAVTVLPITHAKSAKDDPNKLEEFSLVPIRFTESGLSYVSCTQAKTISTVHLRNYVGQASEHVMNLVDETLMKHLGLNRPIGNYSDVDTTVEPAATTVHRYATFKPALSSVSDLILDDISENEQDSIKIKTKSGRKPRNQYSYECVQTGQKFKTLKDVGNFLGIGPTAAIRYVDSNRTSKDGYSFKRI